MKQLLILTAAALIFTTSIAQQKKINEPAFTAAFKQILASSYNNFKEIKGAKIGVKDTFVSKVVLPGTFKSQVDFFGLGSYNGKIKTKTAAENAAVTKQVIAAVTKAFLPLKVKITEKDYGNYKQHTFYALTATGFHNTRVTINEITTIKTMENTVGVYVSAITKREYEFVKKSKTVKDEELKTLITALYKSANNEFWEDVIGEEVDELELPFERPFSMYDGTYFESNLKLDGAETYFQKSEDDDDITFMLAYKIPATLTKAEKEIFLKDHISKLKYALPENYVFEKGVKDYGFFSQLFYASNNYDIPYYEGIDVEASEGYNSGTEDDTYMIITFKLVKTFFKPKL